MPYENDIDAQRLRAAHGQAVSTVRFPFAGSFAQLNITAATYTVQVSDLKAGSLLVTNYGAAGALALTLPTPAASIVGATVRMIGVAAGAISMVAPTADTLVALNDVAADSLAASTAGQIIGAVLEAVCIQTGASTFQWAAYALSNGTTGTVAT